MNYALDAVWWKLKTRVVRDLAVLLTAPPPWLSGCEMPVRTLLGEHGFRYLLSLDDTPQPLHDFLAAHAPFGHRLGLYAEALLAFWLAHAPHSRLHARHWVFNDVDGHTVGAADFIAKLNGTPYHIELACKYYGGHGCHAADLGGFNPQDTLSGKAAKLQQQMALMRRPELRASLAGWGMTSPPQSVSVLRGMLFVPRADLPAIAPLNPYAWQGVWGSSWADLRAALGAAAPRRFAVLERMDLLAPARLPEKHTLDADAVQSLEQGMVAVLQKRPDGHWHEVQRLMKVP